MKPLFADNTALAPTTLAPLSGLSPSYPLTQPNKGVIENRHTLPPVSDADVDNLGASAINGSVELSQKTLTAVRASDAGDFGGKLLAISSAAREMGTLVSPSLLHKLTNIFKDAKNSLMERYDSINTRIEMLVRETERQAQQKRARIPELEALYVANYKKHQQLEEDIERGRTVLLPALNADISTALAESDGFAAQKAADVRTRISRLEKKIDDLVRVQHLCKQFAVQVRMIQDNARTLAAQFDNVKQFAIPVWRDAFVAYIVQLEQKSGAAIVNAIHDTTDSAFKLQADLLRQNSVDIAKTTQRSIVSTDTIKHSHAQLLGTIQDMARIEDEGKQARKAAEPVFNELERELLAVFATNK